MAIPAPSESLGLALFFAIGLLGGAHCLGMCGPLVSLYADRLGTDRDRLRISDVRQHLLFNLGRTLGYAVVGALMGALGALIFDAAAVTPVADAVRAGAGVVVGVLIVGTGVAYVATGSTAHGIDRLPGTGRMFGRVSTVLHRRVDRWVRGPRIVGLGVVHAILPCPILYPAFLYALARGSPVEGALSLTALGLGTLPTLLVYGTLFQSLDTGTRVRLHRVLGVLFVVAGYIPLSHGLMLFGITLPGVHIPIYQPLG